MKKFDVITIGGATLDIMFALEKVRIIKEPHLSLMAFPLGSKQASERVIYTTGGGAANAAVSLAKLGFKTALVAALGKDAHASIILNRFKKEGVDSSLVKSLGYYTGLSFIVTGGHKKEHVLFTHRSANNFLKIESKIFGQLSAKWFYLLSLSGKFWQANLSAVFQAALKQHGKIAWNPGGGQLKAGYSVLKKYLKQTEVLFLNKEEAQALVKSSGIVTRDIVRIFKIIHSWGPKLIAITQGDRGAYFCSGELITYQPALPVTGINTTGAGDAFGSSFIGGLMLYSGDVKRALRLAMIRSNYVVRKIGAQEGLLSLADLKRLKIRI